MRRLVFFSLMLLLSPVLHGQTGHLTIDVSGFRNDRGNCDIYLYNNKDGFPTEPDKAFRKVTAGIDGKVAKAVLTDLPKGVYAVAVVHDENGNGRTDTNFLGIPKEGLGSSNNPRTMGPPRFDDSKFEYMGEDMTVKINIKYIL